MNEDAGQEIIEALLRSRKYRRLCGDTLARIAKWAAARHARPRDAAKAAKRKLHQVYGAYLDQLDLLRAEKLVDALPPATETRALREACREILACHASTEERLPIVEEFYADLFAITGTPETLVDLACGLNPFALPWMPVGSQTRYLVYDIDHRIVAAARVLFEHMDRPGAAECRDILVSPPEVDADLVFLLKTMPCLEQQEQGATLRLLSGLRCRCVVVSFPAQSLGGKAKGMRKHYESIASRLIDDLRATARRLEYPSETVYVIDMA